METDVGDVRPVRREVVLRRRLHREQLLDLLLSERVAEAALALHLLLDLLDLLLELHHLLLQPDDRNPLLLENVLHIALIALESAVRLLLEKLGRVAVPAHPQILQNRLVQVLLLLLR